LRLCSTGTGDLSGCPAAEAGGGLWGALNNCTKLLCREMELFGLVSSNIMGGGGGDQPVPCSSSEDYLLQQARFITTISYVALYHFLFLFS